MLKTDFNGHKEFKEKLANTSERRMRKCAWNVFRCGLISLQI